jgi:NAD(P)H-flavin reductase
VAVVEFRRSLAIRQTALAQHWLGIALAETGRLPEVVSWHGGWGDRQVLVCGRPQMVGATRLALIAGGVPAGRIQNDPLVG